jgi:hypothetical protein
VRGRLLRPTEAAAGEAGARGVSLVRIGNSGLDGDDCGVECKSYRSWNTRCSCYTRTHPYLYAAAWNTLPLVGGVVFAIGVLPAVRVLVLVLKMRAVG